jgi:pectate lyase
VHVFNNLYEATPGWTYYAIRAGVGANIRSEHNIYKDFTGTSVYQDAPTLAFNYHDGDSSSVLETIGDEFINCTESAEDHDGVLGGTFGKGTAFTP